VGKKGSAKGGNTASGKLDFAVRPNLWHEGREGEDRPKEESKKGMCEVRERGEETGGRTETHEMKVQEKGNEKEREKLCAQEERAVKGGREDMVK